MQDFPAAVILAAGMGTRMRSGLVKVLHDLCGRPIAAHVIETVRAAGVARVILVVGHQADKVRAAFGRSVEYAWQAEQLGTGHAVLQARDLLQDYKGPLLVALGDMPLLQAQTLHDALEQHRSTAAAATVVSAVVEDPAGYGRVLRDPGTNALAGLVEEKDAGPEEAAVREINTGCYWFDAAALFEALQQVRPHNAQGEYYLPDAVEIMRRQGRSVGIARAGDPCEAMGINDRAQLAEAGRILRERRLEALMRGGVTVVDPASTYIEPSVHVGRESVVHPHSVLTGDTYVGEACHIGPNARLHDAVVGDGATVGAAHIRGRAADKQGNAGATAAGRSGPPIADTSPKTELEG